MTLVLLMTTNRGIVVAADSRAASYVADVRLLCDDVCKLSEVPRVDRTIVAVTGHAVILDNISPLTTVRSFCDNTHTAVRQLDMNKIIVQVLNTNMLDASSFTPTSLQAVLNHEFNEFIQQHPKLFDKTYIDYCRIIITTFNNVTRTPYILSFRLVLNDKMMPEIVTEPLIVNNLDDRASILFYGEIKFFTYLQSLDKSQVKDLLDAKLISEETVRFVNNKSATRDTETDAAIAVSLELLGLASKLSDERPDWEAIGGPTDVILLGDEPRPKRIYWKTTNP